MSTKPVTALYRVTNRAGPGPARIDLYGDVGWAETAPKLLVDLRRLDGRPIVLHINSAGGSYHEGLAVYTALRRHRGGVTVVVDGAAASIASVIAMAGDRVLMSPHSSIMIHDVQVDGLSGSTSTVGAMAGAMERWSNDIAEIYARRTGGTVASWRARMRAETWFTAHEAVAAGLADEVLPYDREPMLVGNSAAGVRRIVFSPETRRRPPFVLSMFDPAWTLGYLQRSARSRLSVDQVAAVGLGVRCALQNFRPRRTA